MLRLGIWGAITPVWTHMDETLLFVHARGCMDKGHRQQVRYSNQLLREHLCRRSSWAIGRSGAECVHGVDLGVGRLRDVHRSCLHGRIAHHRIHHSVCGGLHHPTTL